MIGPSFLLLLGIGVIAGLLGGLLGIGGGLVMIPSLLIVIGDKFAGPGSIHLYQLASLVTAVCLSTSAVLQHHRARRVVWPIVKSAAPLALVGVFIGTVIAALFVGERAQHLRRAFGVVMILVVGVNTWRRQIGDASARRTSCPMLRDVRLSGFAVGMPAGTLAGLLGIGGGVVAVPVQNLAFGVRLPFAIANSACLIIVVAAAAAVSKSLAIAAMPELNVLDGWYLAAGLVPGALVGASVGARLTHVLPTGILRAAFDVLLVIAGVKLLWG